MHKILIAVAIAVLAAAPARAQTIVGTWQGVAKTQHQIRITQERKNGLSGVFYNFGQDPSDATGVPAASIGLRGSVVTFDVPQIGGHYEGKLGANGKTIVGTWTRQGRTAPLTLERATKETAWRDASPHKAQFIVVDKGISLEVLDWGGTGRSLVFLAGLGFTAHSFDDFAPKFTGQYHIYGITRRGFGMSSAPPFTEDNYDANRLGDDVLAVIDALKLERPILVGHSIAGEELSSIGTRHPEKIAGLVYLDAGYAYALYDENRSLLIDVNEARRILERPGEVYLSAKELVETTLPHLEGDLHNQLSRFEGVPMPPAPSHANDTPQMEAANAVVAGERKFMDINLPVLAIFVGPPSCGQNCDVPGMKASLAALIAQVDHFESTVRGSRVVRLPIAQHFVWESNEADVLREMNAFMATLP